MTPSKKPPSALNPLDSIRRQWAADLIDLARRHAWTFHRRHARNIPAEDLIAEALYALCYAASKFEPGHGVPIEAYAVMVVRHHLIATSNRHRAARRLPTVGDSALCGFSADRDDLTLAGLAVGHELDPAAEVETRELLRRVKRAMPPAEYRVLHLRYGCDCTAREAGKRVGVRRQDAERLVGRAMRKAREVLEGVPS
jgi:RNA polymerase sigma factor (sigma-70 family)